MHHICMISHSDSPWASKYAGYFVDRGYKVSMISFAPAEFEGIGRIDFHSVGWYDERGLLPKGIYFRRLPRVGKILRRIQPDVIFATYVRSNGLVASLAKNAPLMLSARGDDHGFPVPVLGNWLMRFICRRAEQIHAVSEELADKLTGYGIPRERVAVVCTGIQPKLFEPPESPRAAGPPRILCTRKHSPNYDNTTIVQAMALLKNEGFDARCTFASGEAHLYVTREDAARRGVADIVEFTGELTLEQVADQLRSHDIYVSASLSDGTSSSLLEALCTLITPVVSDIRANRDWIEHKRNGYLFKVSDVRDCAAGIRWAWEHRETLLPAKQAARRRVLEEADFDRNTARIEEMLKAIAR